MSKLASTIYAVTQRVEREGRMTIFDLMQQTIAALQETESNPGNLIISLNAAIMSCFLDYAVVASGIDPKTLSADCPMGIVTYKEPETDDKADPAN